MRGGLRYPDGRLWCIVLAAGGSSRLGTAKQLLRYRNRPLILRAMALAANAAPAGVVVVLGAQAIRLRALLKRHCPSAVPVHNSRWRDGLSGSLRTGVDALPANASAALILLTDQAKLEPSSVERLIAVWRARPRRPVAARYGGRIGVPAILPRKLWPRLRRLSGDSGARAILRDREDVVLVDVPEAAFDVDTPADLEAL